MNDLQEYLLSKDFDDYTVFSRRSNSFQFELTSEYILKRLSDESVIYVCKEHILELIAHNFYLQLEYVECLHPGNQYRYLQISDEKKYYDVYITTTNNEISMFFIRESP